MYHRLFSRLYRSKRGIVSDRDFDARARLTLGDREREVVQVTEDAAEAEAPPPLLAAGRKPDGDGSEDGRGGDGEGEAGDDGGKVLVDAGGALLLVNEPVRGGRRQAVRPGRQLPAAEKKHED